MHGTVVVFHLEKLGHNEIDENENMNHTYYKV